jgi:hydrogenase-4 component B
MLYAIVFLPFFGAAASALFARKSPRLRDLFACFVSLLLLGLTLTLPSAAGSSGPAGLPVPGQTLLRNGICRTISGILAGELAFTLDGFRAVYAVITAFMWACTSLFSLEYFRHEQENLTRYWFFVLTTLGATEGVMLSADLMTAFVFFEILSFTSFTWVIHEETAPAIRAGYTYLFIAVIGGLTLFMGLLLLGSAAGTFRFSELPDAVAAARSSGAGKRLLAAGICILLGFGCKAGMFPVHVWLPKAHPVAPSPASALLSGILTKVGIYGILMTSLYAMAGHRVFGVLVLSLGAVTMLLGAVLAVFSVNLKRTLACSSMSQVGFILTGTGMFLLLTSAGEKEGALLALSGTMLHMVNHSLIKLTLFMAAGVFVMDLHTLDLNDLRGWGRNRPLLMIPFALGALGISGVPLFNGYLSKTLLHEGIVEGIGAVSPLLRGLEWVFLFSGGLTFAYMLKLFICVFAEKNADPARQQAFQADSRCMTFLSASVLLLSSLLMPLLGQPFFSVRLASFMTGDPHILEFRAFSWENLKGGLISLAIGAAVYLGFIRTVLRRRSVGGRVSYINLWPERLDLEDLLYRPLLTRILPAVFGAAAAVFGENRLLRPAFKALREGAGHLAACFGENRLLQPLFSAAVKAGAFLARVFTDSTDALVLLIRHTLIRELPVKQVSDRTVTRRQMLREATAETVGQITQNFSFALLMTCIGILLITGISLWFLLR